MIINNKVITPETLEWQIAGFQIVSDMVKREDRSFKTKTQIETEYNIKMSDMKYNQLVSVISSLLRKLPISKLSYNKSFMNTYLPLKCIEDFSKVSSAQVYKYFINSTSNTPLSQNKWVEHYPFLDSIDWGNIYLLASKTVQDTYLITLQYKILHRVYACSEKLFQWKIKDSPECFVCNQVDNLEHYFYYCGDTLHFWNQVENWLNDLFATSVKLTVLTVLLGVLNYEPDHFHAINYVILIGKYFICQSKKNQKDLFFYNYLYTLKSKLDIDKTVYFQNNRQEVFANRFSILSDNL